MNIDKTSKETIIKSLDSIANDLILNKAIQVNESLYALIDIEIYYWHDLHRDDFASGVYHLRPIGEFEAHRYGIDLSLGNQMIIEFGGILLCGLYDIETNKVIEKPWILRTLFNQFKRGNNQINLISNKNCWTETFRTKRMSLGLADTENKRLFEKSFYKYLAKYGQLFKNYKGKEIIFKESELNNSEIKDLLGYNLVR